MFMWLSAAACRLPVLDQLEELQNPEVRIRCDVAPRQEPPCGVSPQFDLPPSRDERSSPEPSPPSQGAPLAGWPVERTELRLRGGMHSPMPGGYVAGYPGDTGLDIGGFRLPVYAVAAGILDYSEPGHTRWMGDDDKAVRLELDVPIAFEDRNVTHVWYAHLHDLAFHQPEGVGHRIRVVAGERLGTSGIANRSPHLHLGFLLDGRVRQRAGTYLLAADIRKLLGSYRLGERLPSTARRR